MIDILKITDEISRLGPNAQVIVTKIPQGYRVHCMWWQNSNWQNASADIDLSKAKPEEAVTGIINTATEFSKSLQDRLSKPGQMMARTHSETMH